MKPEEAYAIWEAMAEIHDCKDNLKLIALSPVGEEIEYYDDPSIKCKVIGAKKVESQGKEMSLTAAAKLISGKNIRLQDQDSSNIRENG